MAGLFGTFSIGTRGLSASQSQINTTAHNIANVNTDGYSRQRAVATTTTPYGGNTKLDSGTVGQVGTGVQISSIERIRDSFQDYQVRTQQSAKSSLEIQDKTLETADDTLADSSSTGISVALNSFTSAFSSLASSATETATTSAKQTAISAASSLADAIKTRYTKLQSQMTSLQETSLGTDVTGINSILDQITSLNKSISSISEIGLTPNDLMDTRDNLLDSLSEKFGITVDSQDDNTIDVSIAGTTTKMVDASDLDGDTCPRFSYITDVSYDDTNDKLIVSYSKLGDSSNTDTLEITDVTTSTAAETLTTKLKQSRMLIADSEGTVASSVAASDIGNILFTPSGGEVGGIQAVQTNIQTSMDDLNKYAATLAYTVNAIQTGSADASGDASNTDVTNHDLVFVTKDSNGGASPTDTGINAGNISVNSVLENDATKLNCGSTKISGEAAGTRAQAIKNISNLKVDFTNADFASRAGFFAIGSSGLSLNSDKNELTGTTNGTTLSDFYTTLKSKLSNQGKKVDSDLTSAETLLASAKNQRTATSGVSLDEETTNLVAYQHAYQANAKVISVIDQLLDVVINGLMA